VILTKHKTSNVSPSRAKNSIQESYYQKGVVLRNKGNPHTKNQLQDCRNIQNNLSAISSKKAEMHSVHYLFHIPKSRCCTALQNFPVVIRHPVFTTSILLTLLSVNIWLKFPVLFWTTSYFILQCFLNCLAYIAPNNEKIVNAEGKRMWKWPWPNLNMLSGHFLGGT
jgi:hypothetical protein